MIESMRRLWLQVLYVIGSGGATFEYSAEGKKVWQGRWLEPRLRLRGFWSDESSASFVLQY